MTTQNNQPTAEKSLTEKDLLDQLMRAWPALSYTQKEIVTATANTFALGDSLGATKQ